MRYVIKLSELEQMGFDGKNATEEEISTIENFIKSKGIDYADVLHFGLGEVAVIREGSESPHSRGGFYYDDEIYLINRDGENLIEQNGYESISSIWPEGSEYRNDEAMGYIGPGSTLHYKPTIDGFYKFSSNLKGETRAFQSKQLFCDMLGNITREKTEKGKAIFEIMLGKTRFFDVDPLFMADDKFFNVVLKYEDKKFQERIARAIETRDIDEKHKIEEDMMMTAEIMKQMAYEGEIIRREIERLESEKKENKGEQRKIDEVDLEKPISFKEMI